MTDDECHYCHCRHHCHYCDDNNKKSNDDNNNKNGNKKKNNNNNDDDDNNNNNNNNSSSNNNNNNNNKKLEVGFCLLVLLSSLYKVMGCGWQAGGCPLCGGWDDRERRGSFTFIHRFFF